MKNFENSNPTNAEKRLFQYAGFYKIESDENHSRYAVINQYKAEHTDVTKFPTKIEVPDNCIDYHSEIVFYHWSETLKCAATFDSTMIRLILDHMAELNWNV